MENKNQEPPKIWSYTSLDKFSRPPGIKTEAARRGVYALLSRLKRTQAKKDPLITQETLQPLSLPLLRKAVPTVELSEPVAALGEALQDWLNIKDQNYSGQVIVEAPHSGASGIVNLWANSQKWQVVQPPSPDQILKDDYTLLEQLKSNTVPWVFPNLERWYLRHTEGLSLIRRLLDLLQFSGHRCLIECDSWAWAYLSNAIKIDNMFSSPLTLDAFGHERLERWLVSTSARPGRAPFVFRQADNGDYVFKPTEEILVPIKANESTQSEVDKKPVIVSNFLKNLAAYCHGNPGVARSIWSLSLQNIPDDKLDENIKKLVGSDNSQVIWVKPWSQLKLPSLNGAKQMELLVLNTLLLHGGLSAKTLFQLLPFSPHEILHTLHELYSSNIIEIEKGIYRVAPISYPSVREKLNGEGYFVDAL